MRKFLALIFVLIFASSACALPRMVVQAFTDRSEEGKAPAGAVMNMMLTELNKAGIFELVERESIKSIADEIALGQSGLVDPSTAIAVGKIRSPQYSMEGAITLYYYSEKGSGFAIPILGSATQAKTAYVMLDLRIVELATGKIIYTANQLGQSKQVAKGAIAAYKGFFIGSYSKTTGGLLATATRDSVMKHVAAIKAIPWKE